MKKEEEISMNGKRSFKYGELVELSLPFDLKTNISMNLSVPLGESIRNIDYEYAQRRHDDSPCCVTNELSSSTLPEIKIRFVITKKNRR